MIRNLMMWHRTTKNNAKIMKNKLSIFTLEGCSQCAKLKQELLINNILYVEVNCTKENEICDNLENLINCDIYPLCVLDYTTNKLILCLTNDFDKINTTSKITDSKSIIYLHSINNMITIIKNS